MEDKRLVILGKFEGAKLEALFAEPPAGSKKLDAFTEAVKWAKQRSLKAEIWFTTGEYDLMVRLDIPKSKADGDVLAHGFILALSEALGVRLTTLTVVAHYLDVAEHTRSGIKDFGHTKMGEGGGG